MEELCGNWLTHWQTDAYDKQIHTRRLLLTGLRLNLYECMSPWIQHDTWEHRGKNAPTESGRAPRSAMFTTSKRIQSFFFFLYLAKHWLQHGEPVRGTVYKKKQKKKKRFKKEKKHERKKKPFCKHGTINRSNSRFRTMHVMTYIFLWYNFHTSHSHQLQFVVFSF